MQVFLVPVGPDRYELYCEEPDDDVAPEQPASDAPGMWRRMALRFRQVLAAAEQERLRAASSGGEAPRGVWMRVKSRVMRWIAESIAEQRLLWQLRGRAAAALAYPDDLSETHAREILRRQLNRDFEKHRFWLAIDSLGLAASALLMLIPGPNVVAYYFAFRIVGHYLSVRGARQGVVTIAWDVQPSAPLTELRTLVPVPPADRASRVDAIAAALRLEHLARFFQRTARV